MKRTRILLLLGLLCGLALGTIAQIAPPDTGKLNWGFFEIVTSEITKSGVGKAAVVRALLTTRLPVTDVHLGLLRDLGYTVLGCFGRMVEVEAPADLYVDAERGLGVLDFVLNADFPPAAQANELPSLMESLPVIGASEAWALGYEGQGAKIAVIEWGYAPFDELDASATASYVVAPDGGIGTYTSREGVAASTVHGTSCALIAANVAPEAELYLLSFPSDQGNQQDLMGWLACLAFAVEDLAVDAVTTQIWFDLPTCHADGTGVLLEAIDQILEGTKTVLVIAAGNWAAGSGSGRAFFSGSFVDADNDGRHDFDADAADPLNRNDLRFSGQAGDTVLVMLEWDDWASDVKTADLDLLVYYTAYDQLPLRVQRTRQSDRSMPPYERLEVTLPYTGQYSVVLEDRAAKWHGGSSAGVHFHLYFLNGDSAFAALEHHSSAGSVREIATSRNPQVVAVGAVAVEEPTSVRPYSSRGPTWDGRCKPDLYGPDGILGTMYSSPFHGTSAAAPHIAGAIAVLRSIDATLSPGRILEALGGSAGCPALDGSESEIRAIDLRRAIQYVLPE